MEITLILINWFSFTNNKILKRIALLNCTERLFCTSVSKKQNKMGKHFSYISLPHYRQNIVVPGKDAALFWPKFRKSDIS